MVTEEETTPNELWPDIKDFILRAATKHVPKKGKRKTTSWLSQEAINLADEWRQLMKEAGLQGSNLYRKLSSEDQLKCERDKSEYINQLCQELQDQSSHNNSRELFRCVKNLTSKTTARLAIIKDEFGKVLTESDEIKNCRKNYCENLYASQEETKHTPEKLPPCGDDEPDILLSEVQKAIKKLKNQKAPGIDDIPSELLKQADDSVAIVLQKLCNSVWKSKIWPEDWKKSV